MTKVYTRAMTVHWSLEEEESELAYYLENKW